MEEAEVFDHFRQARALLEGHFILSSGLHSPVYLQCARVLMDPERAAVLCRALAEKLRVTIPQSFDMVVSPAMGGVIVGYEMARQLGLPNVFMERPEGLFTLRRGFDIPTGSRVLVVEDVVTTGLSSRECIAAVGALGGQVIGEACLIDRSGGTADVGVPLVALATLRAAVYEPDNLPPELAAIPAEKPGSRASAGGRKNAIE